MLFALPFGAGWYTAGGAKTLAYEAVTNALLPFCVKEVLADPTAVAELKVKRFSDGLACAWDGRESLPPINRIPRRLAALPQEVPFVRQTIATGRAPDRG